MSCLVNLSEVEIYYLEEARRYLSLRSNLDLKSAPRRRFVDSVNSFYLGTQTVLLAGVSTFRNIALGCETCSIIFQTW